MYSGVIEGIGPRYCPSIEDKIVKFPEKERQQLFLEPEGIATDEIYVNGFSTCLPFDVQMEMVRTIIGCEHAEIMRPAYAVEYDFAFPTQLHPSLETKVCRNLFLAGQINGTSGYEEAGAQGLMAGINAVRRVQEKAPVILRRNEAYIGVLIDDLVTKGTTEPYRMFTSRAEYRLLLRQDNADLRLGGLGHEIGLLPARNARKLEAKRAAIETELARLEKTRVGAETLAQLLRRPEMTYANLPNRNDGLAGRSHSASGDLHQIRRLHCPPGNRGGQAQEPGRQTNSSLDGLQQSAQPADRGAAKAGKNPARHPGPGLAHLRRFARRTSASSWSGSSKALRRMGSNAALMEKYAGSARRNQQSTYDKLLLC